MSGKLVGELKANTMLHNKITLTIKIVIATIITIIILLLSSGWWVMNNDLFFFYCLISGQLNDLPRNKVSNSVIHKSMWVDGIIACNFDNKSTVFRIGDKLALQKDASHTKKYWGDTHLLFSYKINSLEPSIIVDSNDCIVGLESDNGSVAVNNYKCFDKLSLNKFKSSKYNKKMTQIRAYWGYKQQNISNTDNYLFLLKISCYTLPARIHLIELPQLGYLELIVSTKCLGSRVSLKMELLNIKNRCKLSNPRLRCGCSPRLLSLINGVRQNRGDT